MQIFTFPNQNGNFIFCNEVKNGYVTYLSNIKDKSLRQMSYDSVTMNINRFVDNSIIDSNLQRLISSVEKLLVVLAQNKAKYHKACKGKY